MYKIMKHELALDVNQIAIKAYNKMHLHYWIKIIQCAINYRFETQVEVAHEDI